MNESGHITPERLAAMRAAVERLRPYRRRERRRNDPKARQEIAELIEWFGPLQERATREVLGD